MTEPAPGQYFTIIDNKGNMTTVHIRQSNPIRNWFNIYGDTDNSRRWITHYIWLPLLMN